MPFSIDELEDIRDYLVSVAREGGQMIASTEPTNISVELKKNSKKLSQPHQTKRFSLTLSPTQPPTSSPRPTRPSRTWSPRA